MKTIIFCGYKNSPWNLAIEDFSFSAQEEIAKFTKLLNVPNNYTAILCEKISKNEMPYILYCDLDLVDFNCLLEKIDSIKFVVFYENIINFIQQSCDCLESFSPFDAIEKWEETTSKILSLHSRFPDRVFLISRKKVFEDPKAFGLWLNNKFGVILPRLPNVQAEEKISSSISAITELQIRHQGRLRGLVESIQVILHPLNGITNEYGIPKTNLRELWNSYKISCFLETENNSLKSENTSQNQRISSIGKELKECQEENELLLLQLHQVQEELEHYFFANKELEKSLRGVFNSFHCLQYQQIKQINSHFEGTHKHLAVILEKVNIGNLEFPLLEIRLADHLRNPGIVLFGSEANGVPNPFQPWQTHGHEEHRPYQLLFPSNPDHAKLLLSSTGHSIAFIHDFLKLLDSILCAKNSKIIPPEFSDYLRTHWKRISQLLRHKIESIPLRIHYDDVKPQIQNNGTSLCLNWKVKPIYFSGNFYHSLSITWTDTNFKSVAPTGNIFFQWMDGEFPAFDAWPQNERGEFHKEWHPDFLDFSTDIKKAKKSWKSLGTYDRRLIEAILAELPNLLFHAFRGDKSSEEKKERLQAQAKACLRRVQHYDQKSPHGFLKKILKAMGF